MIAKTRYYLCAVGKPTLVLDKSFDSGRAAQAFQAANRVHREYHAWRGEAILNWAQTRNAAIQIVLLRAIGVDDPK